MKTLFRLLVSVLLLTGWSLAALSLHVVLAPGNPGRIALIPKKNLSITDTWNDVRKWTAGDVVNHPAVVARILENHKVSLLTHVVGEKDTVEKLEQAVIDGINKIPADANAVKTQSEPRD